MADLGSGIGKFQGEAGTSHAREQRSFQNLLGHFKRTEDLA